MYRSILYNCAYQLWVYKFQQENFSRYADHRQSLPLLSFPPTDFPRQTKYFTNPESAVAAAQYHVPCSCAFSSGQLPPSSEEVWIKKSEPVSGMLKNFYQETKKVYYIIQNHNFSHNFLLHILLLRDLNPRQKSIFYHLPWIFINNEDGV